MAKDLAVVVIHGMGAQDPPFAQPMIDELTDRVRDAGHDPDRIAWQSVFWADVLEPRQRRYLVDARRGNDLDFIKLRRFVLSALGDASAYRKLPGAANTTYQQIHARVAQGLDDLYATGLGSTAKPLLVLAHSLGGHIMSNYVWDMQQGTAAAPNPFERMETLAGMVTFGCNIPLFTFAYDPVVPIDFPGPALTPAVAAKAKWLNFFDPDDVLGYPLKPINAAYDNTVDQDIAINVGSILTSWNPLSHTGYWTDNDLTRPVAAFIASFL